MQKQTQFKLGHLFVTRLVFDHMAEDEGFRKHVFSSLERYESGDWGKMCDEDRAQNDAAVNGREDRILGNYEDGEHPEWRIWIITEWDHSATTILFPGEY